jgi:hypothetical protein
MKARVHALVEHADDLERCAGDLEVDDMHRISNCPGGACMADVEAPDSGE